MEHVVRHTRLATTRRSGVRQTSVSSIATGKASCPPAAAGVRASKCLCTEGRGKGKKRAMDAASSVSETVRRKPRGADDRVRLTYSEKVDALDLLKSMAGTAVSDKLGIGVSTLYKWKSNEADIRKKAEAAKPGAKSTKGADFPQVEKEVLKLFEQARAMKIPVQRATVQAFGRDACAALLGAASIDAERKRYSGFIASNGWAKKFVIRNNLKSERLRGEAVSVDEEAIAGGLNRGRKISAGYGRNRTYNVDDTGLLYRVLPKHTYISPGERQRHEAGVKGMRARVA